METKEIPSTKSSDHAASSRNNASWSCETTWAIASGSLENSVTFDSSDDSPVETDSPRKSAPLILKPPSPVSGPCEVNLYFSQKHNIRQIYVRSTARVYELYQSQSQNSDNKYLCTARCCIAERDDQVLQAKFYVESLNNTAISLSVDKFNGEENSATCEDDWVDVKVVDSLPHENRSLSLLNKTNCSTKGVVQDYYEATVEMSDSEPCASVTLRLLSLQSKDNVFIDEIYVFAELVDPIHTEKPAPHVMDSSGSSLMAMLFPTVLQLSKSGKSAIQAEQASDKQGNVNEVEILSKATEFIDVAPGIPQDEKSKTDQQYLKLQDSEKAGKFNNVENLSKVTDFAASVAEIPQEEKLNVDHQFVKMQNLDKFTTEAANTLLQNQHLAEDISSHPVVNGSSPQGRIEEILEQVVSRVSKIEEVCLRFEENMLRPINRMEMRIQRVEEQLESLTKNPYYGLPTGTRIFAPAFSCDSNSISIHNDESDCQSFSRTELDKKEFTSGALSNPCKVMLDSMKAPQLLPSLVVTAPEFSSVDDEQDDDGLDPLKGNNQDVDASDLLEDSPEGKPKLRLIDDVLAAALSNFLLSPSDNPSDCKQTPVSIYDAGQVIGNEMASQNIETLPSGVPEVTASVSAYEEPPNYTQILTVKGPEFVSKNTGADEDLDFDQFPCEEASTSAARTDEDTQVSSFPLVNGLFPVNSELSHCVENKSTFDQVVVTNDQTPVSLFHAEGGVYPETDVQNQFLVGSTVGSLLVRSGSFAADEAKDSARTDFCGTVEEAGKSNSTIHSSPGDNDVMGQQFGCNRDVSSDIFNVAALAAEWPDKEVSSNVFESQTAPLDDFILPRFLRLQFPPLADVSSDIIKAAAMAAGGPNSEASSTALGSQTASLDDFTSPLVDVQFTHHENSSTQSSLEALFGDMPWPEPNSEANSFFRSGGDYFDSEPEESDFVDGVDGNELIDPVTSKRLLVDLGIYDVVGSSDEETGLDELSTASNPNHEMGASLI